MSKKYICENCNMEFTLSEEDKLRCPRCMRVHGLMEERVSEAEEVGATGKKRWLIIGLLVVAALAAVVVIMVSKSKKTRVLPKGKGGIYTQEGLKALLEQSGIQVDQLHIPFTANVSVDNFAKKQSAGGDTDQKKAIAIYKALHGKLKQKGMKILEQELLTKRLVEPTGKVFDRINKGKGSIYNYELIALFLHMARAVNLHAIAMELTTVKPMSKEMRPEVPLGYLVASVFPNGDLNQTPVIIDFKEERPKIANNRFSGKIWRKFTDLQFAAHWYGLRAASFLSKKRNQEANFDSKRALKLDPESPVLIAIRGVVFLNNSAFREATEMFTRFTELRPKWGIGHLMLGMAHMGSQQLMTGLKKHHTGSANVGTGSLQNAIHRFRKALKVQPSLNIARVVLGWSLFLSGEKDEGISLLKKALEIDEGLANAAKVLGAIYMVSNEKEAGKKYLERALEIDPKIDNVHMLLGQYYFLTGNQEKGIEEMRAEIDLHPDSEGPRFVLGSIFIKLNKEEEAEQEFKELLRRSSTPEIWKRRIRKLKEDEGLIDEGDGGVEAVTDGGVEESKELEDGGMGFGGFQLRPDLVLPSRGGKLELGQKKESRHKLKLDE